MGFYGQNIAYRGGTVSDLAVGNAVAPAPPMAPEPSIMKTEGAAGSSGVPTTSPEESRIIKTGSLTLRVTGVLERLGQIRALASAKHGFVENSSVYDSGGPRYGTIVIRIPVSVFDETMNELKHQESVVLQENVQGQDVTMDFVDLEADIRNAKAEETSYLEILKRSGDINDVLAVTQRLADVRGRIERLEGRKRYMEQQTDFSTISVSLTEDAHIEVPGRTWKPGEIIRQAIRDLIDSLQNLISFLIRFVIGFIGLALPIILLIVLIVWLLWKAGSAFMRRMRS